MLVKGANPIRVSNITKDGVYGTNAKVVADNNTYNSAYATTNDCFILFEEDTAGATDSIMDESSVNPDPVNCDDVGKAGPAVTPFLGF